MSAPSLFDTLDGPGAARSTDPASSHEAAECNRAAKASQRQRLLRWMYENGPITADRAFRDLTLAGEDVDRGDWSTRLGGLKHDGLVEFAGRVPEEGRKGRIRHVESYGLTAAGIRTTAVMFSGGGR